MRTVGFRSLHPFRGELKFSLSISHDEACDRLRERVKPLVLGEGYYDTLKSRGVVMGSVSDGRFRLHEAMFGFTGASAEGTISPVDGGSEIRAVLQTSPYIRWGFVVISAVYLFVCVVFGNAILELGPSTGRFTAFMAYTLIYAGAWGLAVRDRRQLAVFFDDLRE